MADEYPYSAFSFQLHWRGRLVAAFTAVDGLESPEPYAADNAVSQRVAIAGPHRLTRVTFKRGLIQDREFKDWVTHNVTGGSATRRIPLELTVLDESREPQLRVQFADCLATSIQGCEEPAAGAAAIEVLTIEHQGYSLSKTC